MILSALKNVKCQEYCLCEGEIDWFYEKNEIRLKISSYIDEKQIIVRLYKPNQIPSMVSRVGHGDFLIDDEILCSWLYTLVEKHIEIPVE